MKRITVPNVAEITLFCVELKDAGPKGIRMNFAGLAVSFQGSSSCQIFHLPQIGYPIPGMTPAAMISGIAPAPRWKCVPVPANLRDALPAICSNHPYGPGA